MAGTRRGPDPRVSHYDFVSTYLTALEAGVPVWPVLRALGLSDHAIERRRWEMSRQGWMPPGPLVRADAPRVRALLKERMREVRERVAAREAEEEARRLRQIPRVWPKREVKPPAPPKPPRPVVVRAPRVRQQDEGPGPVLDQFLAL